MWHYKAYFWSYFKVGKLTNEHDNKVFLPKYVRTMPKVTKCLLKLPNLVDMVMARNACPSGFLVVCARFPRTPEGGTGDVVIVRDTGDVMHSGLKGYKRW